MCCVSRQQDFKDLFVSIRPFFSSIHKSRTAKIVRSLIDTVGSNSANLGLQAEICQDAIAWAESSKRTFLKQRIQTRLAAVYVEMERYNDAIALMGRLQREVKKFDDKLLLVEIFLIESRANLALENLPKSKGALTAARSSANAIYCPPLLQAEIDMQAGILCAAEADFKTAYSYFYESFEGFNTMKESGEAVHAIKYMLLAKVMTGQYDDVYSIVQGKAGVKYAGIEIEAMRAVTDAYKARNVHRFDSIFAHYRAQLLDDPTIASHLNSLKANLLEQNMLRILEPYSRVQVAHVAKLIKLPVAAVEAKLSEMILDGKMRGILDQGTGDVIVWDEPVQDRQYKLGGEIIGELSGVVDRLYVKVKALRQVEV